MTKQDLTSGPFARPWRIFLDICTVPRPSKHEEKIQQWLKDSAASNKWECRSDAIGNIVISVPGKGALADCPPLILQGHMDMVCEKNADVNHDFFTDPIQTHVEGDWLTSGLTTLGADNGVAMAYGLALANEELDDRLPLELLVTIDEETGLTGALELDAGIVTGQHVLNLDSEDDRVFIIGCAGGLDMTSAFTKVPVTSSESAIRIAVTGLRGGHSGICINENRENAILVLGRILTALEQTGNLTHIVSINGGNKRNAIPRESDALIVVDNPEAVAPVVDEIIASFKSNEPAISAAISTEACDREEAIPLSVLRVFSDFPNGVIAMEPDIPDLVRTSCSLGVATTDELGLTLIANTRSSSIADKDAVGERVRQLITEQGGHFEISGAYPGWEPYSGSQLVKRAAEIYKETFGYEPVIQGIHAGLEAGIIGDILGTRELLAFGPLIENAHSPEERLSISSFEASYTFLKQLVSTPITAE